MAGDAPRGRPGAARGIDGTRSNAAAGLPVAHTRLDLLATDLEEEWEHVSSLMVLALGSLFGLEAGVVLTTILLVVAFWDTHRVMVLGGLAGFFLTVSMGVWAFGLHKVRTKPRLFAASLAELCSDRQQRISP